MSVSRGELERFSFEHLSIERDHACFRDLSWRCELRDEVLALSGIIARLKSRGFVERDRGESLIQLTHEAGHSLTIVPATRRVQLRVHYATSPERRVEAALSLAAELETAIRLARKARG